MNLWLVGLILFPIGIIAGILSTVTGLASLVSYPALLLTGLPPIYANVTNTAGLMFTGLGAAISSQRELKGNEKSLLKILPLTVIGSIFGTILLLKAPQNTFEKIVPFFMLGAGFLILFPPKLNTKKNIPKTKNKKLLENLLVNLSILVLGVYCGYFGAGGGIVMMVLFTLLNRWKLLAANALKNISLSASNVIASIIYSFKSHVFWQISIPMGIGFIIGGYIGPMIVRHLSEKVFKTVIAIGAFILAAYLFLQSQGFI